MFSILTLNLRFGLADDGPNSWQYRRKSLAKQLANYPADFFGFQEANDFQIDDLKNFLYDYSYIGQRDPSPPFWQNNIIFYRNTWSCTYSDHFFLSATPEVPSRFRESLWPRQCTIGIFQKNHRRLICANTHFDFDVSVQIKSATLIKERLRELPSGFPAILVGDFNAPPTSPGHNIFTGKDQKAMNKAPAFKSVFKAPFFGTHHGFTGIAHGDQIDWILYYGGINPIDAGIIRDTANGVYPSDHFPVYASFEWLA